MYVLFLLQVKSSHFVNIKSTGVNFKSFFIQHKSVFDK